MSWSCRVIKEPLPTQDTWLVVREQPTDGAGANLGQDPEAVSHLLASTQERAEEILAQAEADARDITVSAECQSAEAMQEASEIGLAQGRDRGYTAGLAQAQAENRDQASRLQALAQRAEQEQLRQLAGLETQLVDLALAIARKIIGAELATQPALILEIVARAIEEAHGSGQHAIRLHPSDVQLVRPYLPQAALEAGGREWEVRPDDTLSPGDCLIETAFGIVDATIETQLSELTHLLKGAPDDAVHHG